MVHLWTIAMHDARQLGRMRVPPQVPQSHTALAPAIMNPRVDRDSGWPRSAACRSRENALAMLPSKVFLLEVLLEPVVPTCSASACICLAASATTSASLIVGWPPPGGEAPSWWVPCPGACRVGTREHPIPRARSTSTRILWNNKIQKVKQRAVSACQRRQ